MSTLFDATDRHEGVFEPTPESVQWMIRDVLLGDDDRATRGDPYVRRGGRHDDRRRARPALYRRQRVAVHDREVALMSAERLRELIVLSLAEHAEIAAVRLYSDRRALVVTDREGWSGMYTSCASRV